MLMNFLALMLPEKEIFWPGPGGKVKINLLIKLGTGKKLLGKEKNCSAHWFEISKRERGIFVT